MRPTPPVGAAVITNPDYARLLRRVRVLTWLFIIGLVISGVTAIPLQWELEILTRWFPYNPESSGTWAGALGKWFQYIHNALADTNSQYPQLAYGTDWLAFGHFMIALAFVGPLRDPVRNVWLFTFGMIACILVIPYALVFGAIREIPLGWRIIDCLFGLLGFPLVALARYWTKQLERIETQHAA